MDSNSTIEIKPLAHAHSKQQTQSIALYQSEIRLPVAVSVNSLCLQELDSLYLIVTQASLPTDSKDLAPANFKIISLTQRSPLVQMQTLLDAKMYTSALNLAEQLRDNDCPLVSLTDYVTI